jgi:hypothetical protein
MRPTQLVIPPPAGFARIFSIAGEAGPGIQGCKGARYPWMPAFAGMTDERLELRVHGRHPRGSRLWMPWRIRPFFPSLPICFIIRAIS